MAQEPDSVAFRFATVLALAVIILVVMTLAAPPPPANGTAAPIPSCDPIYRGSIFEFVLSARCSAFCCAVALVLGDGRARAPRAAGFPAAARDLPPRRVLPSVRCRSRSHPVHGRLGQAGIARAPEEETHE